MFVAFAIFTTLCWTGAVVSGAQAQEPGGWWVLAAVLACLPFAVIAVREQIH
jgi:hypothetical protein